MKRIDLIAVPKHTLLLAIKLYQRTRFFRTPSCRFYPSCSQYMAGCVEQHGFAKGSYLALLRLLKCHPLHQGGIDDVPARVAHHNNSR